MYDMGVLTARDIELRNPNDEQGLPDSLRKWLVYPDEWNQEREIIHMRNEWLQVERDEIME